VECLAGTYTVDVYMRSAMCELGYKLTHCACAHVRMAKTIFGTFSDGEKCQCRAQKVGVASHQPCNIILYTRVGLSLHPLELTDTGL